MEHESKAGAIRSPFPARAVHGFVVKHVRSQYSTGRPGPHRTGCRTTLAELTLRPIGGGSFPSSGWLDRYEQAACRTTIAAIMTAREQRRC
jgi:hypothetical protein